MNYKSAILLLFFMKTNICLSAMLYGGSGLASAEGVISLSFFAVLCAFPCCASLRLYDMKIVAFLHYFR